MARYTAEQLCSMSNEKLDRLMLLMLFDAEDCRDECGSSARTMLSMGGL